MFTDLSEATPVTGARVEILALSTWHQSQSFWLLTIALSLHFPPGHLHIRAETRQSLALLDLSWEPMCRETTCSPLYTCLEMTSKALQALIFGLQINFSE